MTPSRILMKKLSIPTTIVSICALFLLDGCVRSLHPFYQESDIITDSMLVGSWSEGDSDEVWKFEKQEDSDVYDLTLIDKNEKAGEFVATLLKLKGELFLDFFPKSPDLKTADFYKFHIMPVHTFAYVTLDDSNLKMKMPSPKWFKEYVEKHPDALKHEMNMDEAFVTASTEEMQAFWLSHLETDEAFGDFMELKRR